MSAQESGLSLEGLAHRLETLERENAQLRDEVTALRGSHTPRYRDEEPTSEFSEPEEEERMSRRRMLSRAGAAAVGLVVAGAFTQRDIREAEAAILVGSTDQANRGGVEGTNTSFSGYGVWGNSNGIGVQGTGVMPACWVTAASASRARALASACRVGARRGTVGYSRAVWRS